MLLLQGNSHARDKFLFTHWLPEPSYMHTYIQGARTDDKYVGYMPTGALVWELDLSKLSEVFHPCNCAATVTWNSALLETMNLKLGYIDLTRTGQVKHNWCLHVPIRNVKMSDLSPWSVPLIFITHRPSWMNGTFVSPCYKSHTKTVWCPCESDCFQQHQPIRAHQRVT